MEETHSYSVVKNWISSSFESAGYRLEKKYKAGKPGEEKGFIRASMDPLCSVVM